MPITTGLHATILATTLTAIAAISIAGTAIHGGGNGIAADKADRLAVEHPCESSAAAQASCDAAAGRFLTVELRREGGSVLTRVLAVRAD